MFQGKTHPSFDIHARVHDQQLKSGKPRTTRENKVNLKPNAWLFGCLVGCRRRERRLRCFGRFVSTSVRVGLATSSHHHHGSEEVAKDKILVDKVLVVVLSRRALRIALLASLVSASLSLDSCLVFPTNFLSCGLSWKNVLLLCGINLFSLRLCRTVKVVLFPLHKPLTFRRWLTRSRSRSPSLMLTLKFSAGAENAFVHSTLVLSRWQRCFRAFSFSQRGSQHCCLQHTVPPVCQPSQSARETRRTCRTSVVDMGLRPESSSATAGTIRSQQRPR